MEEGRGADHRRIAIEVQYDGTHFNGWQIQNGRRTVQEEIEKAIRVLLKERIRIVASGRTDTGVHAIGQIAHFDTVSTIGLQRICIGLNGILPRDISIRNAYHVHADFHARFGAVRRSYRYLIYNHPSRTPFMQYRAMWVHEKLDVGYLRRVAALLIGENDFSSFCKKRESFKVKTVRRITEINIRRHHDLVKVDIAGNAFLHNMVRIIVGTMIDMNKAEESPERILDVIARRDRVFSGKTAPPYGLYLMKVMYDPDLTSMDAAFFRGMEEEGMGNNG
ncbi:MAG: tRNA pseudouridine(38-40) synthase TruA [Spirochaetes bacterium]|nr:tRNA pseudouridine(38-40) synthase TruA [Spirochaetota bacterium]